MKPMVVSGAGIICVMAAGAGTLNATSQPVCIAGGKPAATVKDTAPFINVSSCGMCTTTANPAVASATAAALGVLTPQPCVPAPVGIWMPGGTVIVGGTPCLTMESSLMCAYGGNIRLTSPGQAKVLA